MEVVQHIPKFPNALNASAAILVSGSSTFITFCALIPLSWLMTLVAGLATSVVPLGNSDRMGVWNIC